MLWVVLAGISLCLKVCLLANKSSRNSYSSYSSSSAYDPYGLKSYKNSQSYESLKADLDRLSAKSAVSREFEKLVQRNCSGVRSQLKLEIDFPEPGMSSLAREVRRASLPKGAWLPAPLVAQGLGVTVHDGSAEDWRLCLDADEALLKDLLLTAKPSAELVKLGVGAWSVTTSDSTATTAMVSSTVLDAMKVKGQLVAFAPTDNLVVFADGANAAGVAQAAKYAAEHTTTSGSDGCVPTEPLPPTNGPWGPWRPNRNPSTPAEGAPRRGGEAGRVAARERQANRVGPYLQALVELREAGISGVPFVDTHDGSERAFSAKRSSVTLALDDSSVPQLLSPANDVKLETEDGRVFSMSWETFVAVGGTRVVPVLVKGTPVPNPFFFEGGLSSADFAGKKGVTSKKL